MCTSGRVFTEPAQLNRRGVLLPGCQCSWEQWGRCAFTLNPPVFSAVQADLGVVGSVPDHHNRKYCNKVSLIILSVRGCRLQFVQITVKRNKVKHSETRHACTLLVHLRHASPLVGSVPLDDQPVQPACCFQPWHPSPLPFAPPSPEPLRASAVGSSAGSWASPTAHSGGGSSLSCPGHCPLLNVFRVPEHWLESLVCWSRPLSPWYVCFCYVEPWMARKQVPLIGLLCLTQSVPFSHKMCVCSVSILHLLTPGTELNAGEMKEVEMVLHIREVWKGEGTDLDDISVVMKHGHSASSAEGAGGCSRPC